MILKSQFLLILLLSSISTAFAAPAECQKTMGWNNDNPLQQKSPDELHISRDIELMQRVLAKLDCKIKFVQMPWARSIVELENGRIDIMGGAYKTQDRQQFAWYSDLAFESANVLFMRTEDINKYSITSLQDIQKYQLRIGTQINVIYSDEFNSLLADKNFARLIHPNTSRQALWNMLEIGRIDGFISELTLGMSELKKLDLNAQISPSDFVVSRQATYFIFSKKSVTADFVKAVDHELALMSDLGVLESLQKKYQ
ncbi:substrate-binding periplasmic protein [Paraglaciecola hydrolytica]|uniref:Solute-binding protein family 3/N-terminal domain-containing protein n=1 Tax=Paraglaciecola hydrolytica TaxID=1799789 RepID=A0A135ZYM9_9ALTE|nr:transporter substrate-binding domain-containing protein [Paraglaciecola hydrolytica]KXI28081.1 hypothetical protein AX660_16985 [Paraglaciecola hydrolytica]